MNTEITKIKNRKERGRVFYDAECSLCLNMLRRFGGLFTRAGFQFVPLQEAIDSGTYPVPAEEFYREMKLLRADGTWLGGFDAWLELWSAVWWLRPLVWLFRLPGLHALGMWGYRKTAANRRCFGNACTIMKGNNK